VKRKLRDGTAVVVSNADAEGDAVFGGLIDHFGEIVFTGDCDFTALPKSTGVLKAVHVGLASRANDAVAEEKMQFPEKVASSKDGAESENTQSAITNFSSTELAWTREPALLAKMQQLNVIGLPAAIP
jgi:hypothetical protein